MLGYFGGKLDILGQRVIEIWSSLPFLYTIIIVSSIVVPVYIPGTPQLLQPSFWLLVVILAAFDWMGITYYVRGEFYREKAKDYVGAAIATGVSERRHHVQAHPAERADAGRVLRAVHDRRQHRRARRARLPRLRIAGADTKLGRADRPGHENLTKWWLVFFPLGALFLTLLLVVFIGEAVREAFDPQEYSRLR